MYDKKKKKYFDDEKVVLRQKVFREQKELFWPDPAGIKGEKTGSVKETKEVPSWTACDTNILTVD